MSDATKFILLISALGGLGVFLVPVLRWFLFPVSIVMITGILHGQVLIGGIGGLLFGAAYGAGKLQVHDRADRRRRIDAGERLPCSYCHGSGKDYDSFAMMVKVCPSCGGGGVARA